MIVRVFSFLMANILLIATCMPQNAAVPDSEIHRLFLADQRDRGEGQQNRDPKDMAVSLEKMNANDAARRKRVHELLEQGVLQTAADFHDAAFVYQHGDTPDDYLLAHVLAMVAVAKGDVRSRWISAATLDRYLQGIGEPQVFGTQYPTRGYSEYLRQARATRATAHDSKPKQEIAAENAATPPSNAPRGDEAVKKSVIAAEPSAKWDEYLQEPYNSALIGDALRAQYCVVGIEQQKKNVASLNAGKGFPQRLMPGCAE